MFLFVFLIPFGVFDREGAPTGNSPLNGSVFPAPYSRDLRAEL